MFKLFVALAALMGFLSNCSTQSGMYKRGVLPVGVSGTKVYFKREIRGLSYDVLVLSTNGDPCTGPDPAKDYIFATHAATLFYKIEGNTLTLFLMDPAAEPNGFSSSVRVLQNQLTNPEFIRLNETYPQHGLVRVDVPVDALDCK